jgi:hypothetical protein
MGSSSNTEPRALHAVCGGIICPPGRRVKTEYAVAFHQVHLERLGYEFETSVTNGGSHRSALAETEFIAQRVGYEQASRAVDGYRMADTHGIAPPSPP